MSETIYAGDLLTHDPSDSRLYVSDWDERNLAAGVELADAGTFTIEPNDGELVIEDATLVAGNRTVRFRMRGGVLGRRYRVHHAVTTDESPSQDKEQSFYVLVQNR